MQSSMSNAGLSDLRLGEVASVKPLAIKILDSTMEPIPASALFLTANVVEKKLQINSHTHDINSLSHSHTVTGGSTGTSLNSIYSTQQTDLTVTCLENGVVLPTEPGAITINQGLSVGDKVIMLSVMSSQKYIVLSRLFLP